MFVNFRVREISRGARKLTRTPTLIKKNIIKQFLMILTEKPPEKKKQKKNRKTHTNACLLINYPKDMLKHQKSMLYLS